jgi:predicted RNA binding protein YcfA (HicA-like mRNA interferase family)
VKVPRGVSGQRCVRALGRLGFVPERQKGSHLTMHNASTGRTVVVPMHPVIAVGMLAAILEDAGIELSQFMDAL